MRIFFVGYLVFITLGLAACFLLGALHR